MLLILRLFSIYSIFVRCCCLGQCRVSSGRLQQYVVCICCCRYRGRLLNDVWLLDIFDWRPVAGPIAASEAAGVGSSGDVDPTSGSGGDAAAAGSARDITLSWIYLDFSSSPLKPPGRFLHSCSVFYTSANDGSCSIVRMAAASSAGLSCCGGCREEWLG